MIKTTDPAIAAKSLLSDGLIAYPTETVYGLGCLPSALPTISRLLDLKRRPASKGLILLATDLKQISRLIKLQSESLQEKLLAPTDVPTTWIVPAKTNASELICGTHTSIAIRITQHPLVSQLCLLTNSAIISTSANISGNPPPKETQNLDTRISQFVDLILEGACGTYTRPSVIRDLETDQIFRE